MNFSLKALRLLIIVSLILFLYMNYWLNLELFQNRQFPSEGIIFEVEKGMSVNQISNLLAKKKIIVHPLSIQLLYYLYYFPLPLKAGEYKIEAGESLKSVLIKMINGRVLLHQVTIPEGLTAKEIVTMLSFLNLNEMTLIEAIKNPQLIADLDPEAQDLEGYLFPETYYFPKGISPTEVVKVMTNEFRKNFPETWQAEAKRKGFTLREIVILASLIEKETGLPEERPLVSAVFHNRLKKGLKLDCDPTIIYALQKAGINKKELFEKDLKFPSPYNTYLYAGLPPGPICNPGREALKAALFPAQVDYLYFVSKGNGRHHFSVSYSEHLKAISLYRKRANQQSGRRVKK
ncbi:MAG: endolytic transglycosylase MltG [Candidatus Aminicenantes bacterium]|nr:endolytic transglycosylase MltG [Candidatus Aminicenantes bacterium]